MDIFVYIFSSRFTMNPLDNLINSTLENLREIIDVNTIVGDAIPLNDDGVILPISKVSLGFVSGGSDIPSTDPPEYPFGGASGAGVSLKPVAFLVIKRDNIRLLPLDASTTIDKLVDRVPQLIDIIKGKTNCDSSSTYSYKNETEPME